MRSTAAHRLYRRRAAASAAAAGIAATLAAGCGASPAPAPGGLGPVRGVAAVEPAASPKPFAAGDLAFGLDLLGAMCAQEPTQNVVLSPVSLASSLGLAYLGARGQTAQTMAATLHLPASGNVLAGLQARTRALGELSSRGVTVAEADEVWADPKLVPYRSYLNAAATGYGAPLGRVPLLTDKAAAAQQIDAAVGAATRGHIPRLLTPGDLQQAVFVLTNALYLKAAWSSPFSSGPTPMPFTTSDGKQVRASYLSDPGFRSGVVGGWTAVQLPYRGGRLAMEALLPPAQTGGSGCQIPSAPVLNALASTVPAGDATTSIDLPAVKLRSQVVMNGILQKLGMGLAFSPNADFSGLSSEATTIGLVVHAATLQVDQQGTVASAASGVVMVPTSGFIGGTTVVFNRPYLLLVTDTGTGEPLFLARVTNPDLP
jgi:serine protease inhibitor